MNKDIFKKDIKDIFKMEVSLKGILIKVIILLAILSYGYFGLYPQYQKYIATKNSVKQATEKLNIYKEKTALMPKYEKQLEEVESELKEKKLRIEDALNATKAAVAEGIVIGGGAALVEAYKELKPVLKNDNVDVQKGINIVMEALLSPICQIAENAGYNSEDIVDMQKSAAKNQGFDAKNGEWVDMFDKGIIDPTKVTRSALLNAASISALFITTEAGVAEIKSETPEAPMMPNQMY